MRTSIATRMQALLHSHTSIYVAFKLMRMSARMAEHSAQAHLYPEARSVIHDKRVDGGAGADV